MAGRPWRYTLDQRDQALALLDRGLSGLQVAARLGVDRWAVCRWAKNAGMTMRMGPVGGALEPRRPVQLEGDWIEGRGRLTEAGRALIAIRLAEGRCPARIAAELGVHRSTVTREVGRNRVDGVYSARAAQRQTQERRPRPQQRKLDRPENVLLRAEVIAGLDQHWSPQQIQGELLVRFPQDESMRVSHETIYQSLYVQGRGSLRQELAREKALRTGRTSRIPASRLAPRGPGKSWVGDATISARPAEVADRAVPGHWEGDLIIGARGQSAAITLVERVTRYTLIARLPERHDSATVTDRLVQLIGALPAHLAKTLTWDQGSELAEHARFSVAADVKVYFCDPHSPWQRGTNENTNGLIREFFPKGTDFSKVTDEQVLHVEHLLNTRPRATLGFHTPTARLNELLTVALTG